MKLEKIKQAITGRLLRLGFGFLTAGALLILAGLSSESLALFAAGGILVIAFAAVLLKYLRDSENA